MPSILPLLLLSSPNHHQRLLERGALQAGTAHLISFHCMQQKHRSSDGWSPDRQTPSVSQSIGQTGSQRQRQKQRQLWTSISDERENPRLKQQQHFQASQAVLSLSGVAAVSLPGSLSLSRWLTHSWRRLLSHSASASASSLERGPAAAAAAGSS